MFFDRSVLEVLANDAVWSPKRFLPGGAGDLERSLEAAQPFQVVQAWPCTRFGIAGGFAPMPKPVKPRGIGLTNVIGSAQLASPCNTFFRSVLFYRMEILVIVHQVALSRQPWTPITPGNRMGCPGLIIPFVLERLSRIPAWSFGHRNIATSARIG